MESLSARLKPHFRINKIIVTVSDSNLDSDPFDADKLQKLLQMEDRERAAAVIF